VDYSRSTSLDTRRGIVGLILVAIGTGLLLREWGWMPAVHLSRYIAPAVLIGLGVSRWMTPRADGRGGSGLLFIGLGVLLLLGNLHVWALHQSWPLLLVIAGFGIMLKAMRPSTTDEGIRR
jgi:hypothetical protein